MDWIYNPLIKLLDIFRHVSLFVHLFSFLNIDCYFFKFFGRSGTKPQETGSVSAVLKRKKKKQKPLRVTSVKRKHSTDNERRQFTTNAKAF